MCPGLALASLEATLEGGRDHSALAWGSLAQPRLLLLADDNTVPAAASIRLRVVNALGDNVAVNALVNFVNRAPALGPGSAAPYADARGRHRAHRDLHDHGRHHGDRHRQHRARRCRHRADGLPPRHLRGAGRARRHRPLTAATTSLVRVAGGYARP